MAVNAAAVADGRGVRRGVIWLPRENEQAGRTMTSAAGLS
jgi:hypothetical protein